MTFNRRLPFWGACLLGAIGCDASTPASTTDAGRTCPLPLGTRKATQGWSRTRRRRGDGLDASKPQCLHGGPCSCDDVASHNGTAICSGGAWQCPTGYTRFEDCHGVPPSAECRDAALDTGSDQ